MSVEWKIEKRKMSELKDYHKNPRKLTKTQANTLKKSLAKFGLIDKPIINTDNTIIGGHQRKAILEEEFEEIEVFVPNRKLKEKEVEELNIRLNQTGDFDWDILANEFDLYDLLDWGFDSKDLQIDCEEEPSKEPKEKTSKLCPNCGHEF